MDQQELPTQPSMWIRTLGSLEKNLTKHDGLPAEEFMGLQSLRALATQLHLYFNGPI